MPLLPTVQAVQATFFPTSPIAPFVSSAKQQSTTQSVVRSRYQAREELYRAWSTVDDVKATASKVGGAATKEFEKASNAAQAKTGKIELYSAKYYAACTFGGLMACVRDFSVAYHAN
jgi:solute carrier family 25 phosphate transporter 3